MRRGKVRGVKESLEKLHRLASRVSSVLTREESLLLSAANKQKIKYPDVSCATCPSFGRMYREEGRIKVYSSAGFCRDSREPVHDNMTTEDFFCAYHPAFKKSDNRKEQKTRDG